MSHYNHEEAGRAPRYTDPAMKKRQAEQFAAQTQAALTKLASKENVPKAGALILVDWRDRYPFLRGDINAVLSHVALVDTKIFLARDLANQLKEGKYSPQHLLDFSLYFRENTQQVRWVKIVDVYRLGTKLVKLPDAFLRSRFQCIRDMGALDRSVRLPLTKTFVFFQNVCNKKITGPSLWEMAVKATNAVKPKSRAEEEAQKPLKKPPPVRSIAQERLIINAVFVEANGVLKTSIPAFKDGWKDSLPFKKGEIVIICQVHPDAKKKAQELDVDMEIVEDCLFTWLFYSLSTMQNTKFALVFTGAFCAYTNKYLPQALKEGFANRLMAKLGGPIAAFNFARQPMDIVNASLRICDEHEYKERWVAGGSSKLQPLWEIQSAYQLLD